MPPRPPDSIPIEVRIWVNSQQALASQRPSRSENPRRFEAMKSTRLEHLSNSTAAGLADSR
jgi:hypothetical protein